MRSGIVLAFVMATAGSVSPAAAQIQGTRSPTSIGDQRALADSKWSRVRRLEAGSEIAVVRNRIALPRRSFVRCDDTELTVLNLTDPTLPPAAVKMLRALMTNHPTYFVREHTVVDGNIRNRAGRPVRRGSQSCGFRTDRRIHPTDRSDGGDLACEDSRVVGGRWHRRRGRCAPGLWRPLQRDRLSPLRRLRGVALATHGTVVASRRVGRVRIPSIQPRSQPCDLSSAVAALPRTFRMSLHPCGLKR
jgi:hypothetical protein